VKFGSSFRRIKATVSNIDIPRNHYNKNRITFSISFLCKEPFFSDIPMIETTFFGKTASFQDEVINQGTADVFPITTILYNSATGTNSLAV